MTKLILFLLAITTFTACSNYRHPYDYVLEVDGTDSIETFYIYDHEHIPVGHFTNLHPDSLQIIINQDNL